MSACWASDVRRGLWLVALLGVLGAGTAAARVTVNGVTLGDSGRASARVRVSPGGISITTSGPDTSGTIDSLGHGAIVIDEGAGMVHFLSAAEVRAGEHVDGDVVAIFGDVRIAGTVNGAAVALLGRVDIARGGSVGGDAVSVIGGQNSAGTVTGAEVTVLGSTQLLPGASVGGDAVAVGGHVVESAGTHVGGQIVSLSLLPVSLGFPTLIAVLVAILLGWLVNLFFGWLFVLLFPERLVRVAVTSSRRTFLSIVAGLLSGLLWIPVVALLCVTCLGAPVGVVLLVAYPLAMYAGQLGATHVLGSKLLRRGLDARPTLAPIAVGSLLIAAFQVACALSFISGGLGKVLALFFFLVAQLVLAGLGTIGGGAVLLSRLGSVPADLHPAGEPAGQPPLPVAGA